MEQFRELRRDDFDRLEKSISKAMDKLQENHQEWFDKRERNKNGIGENLRDHYTLHVHNADYTFSFAPGSDLPKNIKEECYAVFKTVFENK